MKHRAVIVKRLLPEGHKNIFEGSSDIEIKEKESNSKNIPHEEVFIGYTIIGIFFDSCIA